MKKRSIFCSFIFSSLCLWAQLKPVVTKTTNQKSSPPVCSIVEKILDNRKNDFKDIYTWDFKHTIPDDIHGYAIPGIEHTWDIIGYDSKLKFPGAAASFVDNIERKDQLCYRYIACWGRYKTEAEGAKKLEVIKNQVSNCLTNYELVKLTDDGGLDPEMHMLTKFEFRSKDPEKKELKIFLQFEQGNYDDKNYIFLLFEGNTYVKENDKWVKTSEAVKNNQSNNQTQFAKQLLELLAYSKDGFKTIRGEKIKTAKEENEYSGNTSIINYYKPKYSMEDAREISIKETFSDQAHKNISKTEFSALYGDNLSMSEAENIYNNLSTLIKKEFTNDFETNENRWDLSNTGDIYTKSLYVKEKKIMAIAFLFI